MNNLYFINKEAEKEYEQWLARTLIQDCSTETLIEELMRRGISWQQIVNLSSNE